MTPDDLIEFLDKRSDVFLRNCIKKLSRRLKRVAAPGDVYQELIARLLPKLAQYRRERSDPDTFLGMAAFRCLASILRDQLAAKRFIKTIKSLHDLVNGLDGRRQRLVDTLDDRQPYPRRGRSRRSQTELSELGIDLDEAIQALPPDLRAVAQHLG